MERLLQLLLVALGLSTIVVGLSFVVIGPFATTQILANLLSPLIGTTPIPTAFQDPSVNTELAFLATFWMAYGVYTLNAARQPNTMAPVIAAGLFALAGLARIPSLIFAETPIHPLFRALMGIELAVPLLLLSFWWITHKRTTQ